ncbi:MAG: methylmalonyl Co-A mutase-associated GTPase MeaB, partial [Rhodospirillaceae bacterium]|nr:methylmalonyl Co-A mutase-associated GTPase MeaB [Rhodospirillaceae bacterium]
MSGSSAAGLSLEAIAAGGKKALSTALAELEKAPESPACLDLLSQAYKSPKAHVIGVTGPPGV